MGEAISLQNFLEEFSDVLNDKIIKKLKPAYNPAQNSPWTESAKQRVNLITKEDRKPYPAQMDAILAGVKHLETDRALMVQAEMGCGKTLISLLIAAMDKKPRRHLVVCPPHLVEKWCKEVHKTFPDNIATAIDISGKDSICRIKQIPSSAPVRHEFYVMSRERAKAGYYWKNSAVVQKRAVFKTFRCPDCGAEVEPAELARKRKAVCPECRGQMWQARGDKIRRYAPAEFIKRKIPKGFFTYGIFDEVHELKGESAQGVAFGQIASRCTKVIGLTGTLMGGYADDIFYLLWRSVPRVMQAGGEKHHLKSDWLEKYGVLEKVYRPVDRHNAASRSMRLVSIKRRPGMAPQVLAKYLIPHTIFLRLSDMAANLPPYEEQVHTIQMDACLDDAYREFEKKAQSAARSALSNGDMRVLSQMIQELLSWPDDCNRRAEILNRDNLVVASAAPVELETTAKERALFELLKKARSEGRKVLIYLEFTGTKDISESLKAKLQDRGFSVLHLKSTVAAGKRQAWIESKLKSGHYDCMICNPRLVQTGLDLLDFPEIVYFQTGYSIFVLRQSSRRSWRLGQRQPVRVHFLCNAGTMQETAMSLIAKKLETSLAVEGQLSESGLVSLSDGSGMGSIVKELAKSLVENAEIEGVEKCWSRYRQKEFISDMTIGEQVIKTENLEAKKNKLKIVKKRTSPVQLTLF